MNWFAKIAIEGVPVRMRAMAPHSLIKLVFCYTLAAAANSENMPDNLGDLCLKIKNSVSA